MMENFSWYFIKTVSYLPPDYAPEALFPYYLSKLFELTVENTRRNQMKA